MITRLLAVIALSAPLAAMGAEPELGSSRLEVIDDPLRVEFRSGAAPTQEKIRQTIAIVAPSREWKVLAEGDGRFELARTVNKKHGMRIELTYGPAGYEIRYLDSSNLLYRELRPTSGRVRAIHKNYNVWIRELASSINGGLGVSASFPAPTPQAMDPRPPSEPRPPSGWISPRNRQ